MLNNKGFAVSTVLYTLLIAFLLFLGATLAMFSTSTSVVGNANTDLTDGSKLEAKQVKLKNDEKTCIPVQEPTYSNGVAVIPQSGDGNYYWYETGELITDAENKKVIKDAVILKINSKYGTLYWPKDFGTVFDVNTGAIVVNATSENGVTNSGDGTVYKNIKVQCSKNNIYQNPNQCNINWRVSDEPGRLDILRLRIIDTLTNENYEVRLYDLCQ